MKEKLYYRTNILNAKKSMTELLFVTLHFPTTGGIIIKL